MPGKIISIFDTGDYERFSGEASAVLREGGVVILPTETVYGAATLLASATGRDRLRSLKPAAEARPLTIHLASPDEGSAFVGDITDIGKRLMKKLWPGPVGLMFDVPPDRRAEVARKLGVAEHELYHDGSITLRCPDHLVARDVIAEARAPVVLTQAPTATAASATAGPALRVSDIAPDVLRQADLVLDAGPSRFNKPSTLLKVKSTAHAHDSGYEVVRAGVYDQRIIERMLKTTLLFICSGNTCRSPMASAIARHQLAQRLGVSEDKLEEKGYQVLSAGSFALPGAKATPQAVDVIRELGGDLSSHRSRPLTLELVHQADFIFTMSRSHRASVLAMVPSAADKTFMLDPSGADIEDPIGSEVGVYRTLAGEMQKLIRSRLDQQRIA
jgi:protein-tyrosine phosphatase